MSTGWNRNFEAIVQKGITKRVTINISKESKKFSKRYGLFTKIWENMKISGNKLTGTSLTRGSTTFLNLIGFQILTEIRKIKILKTYGFVLKGESMYKSCTLYSKAVLNVPKTSLYIYIYTYIDVIEVIGAWLRSSSHLWCVLDFTRMEKWRDVQTLIWL